MKPDMKVKLAGLELTNPVIAASGTFGYGIEFEEIVSLERIGGFVTKGISLEPMPGHPAPRIIQTAAGMLNAIGLQNVGVEEFIAKKLPPLAPLSRLQGHRQRLRLHGGRLHRASSNGSTRPKASPPTNSTSPAPTCTPAAWPSAPTAARSSTWSAAPGQPPSARSSSSSRPT